LRKSKFFLCLGFLLCTQIVWAQSNVILRVMAANLTSGNYQRYETPGLNIRRPAGVQLFRFAWHQYTGIPA